jgi:transcriptional regulator with XRE-family HTH domain
MKSKILVYNTWHNSKERLVMPKKLQIQLPDNESFGERMARLRKKAGYTQRNLASETGISQRMIAYYEKQTQYPPTHLLPVLSKALGTSTDELLGINKTVTDIKKKDMRLWRRFGQIEKMDVKEKRQILQLLDTFIEKEQLKEKINNG